MKDMKLQPGASLSKGLFRTILIMLFFLAIPSVIALASGRIPRVSSEGATWLFAGLLAAILQETMSGVIAWASLASTGVRTRIARLLLLMMASTSMNSSIPAPTGIPIRLFLQRRYLGVDTARTTAALLIESAIGFGLIILLALLAPLFAPAAFSSAGGLSGTPARLIGLFVVITMVALLLAVSRKLRRLAAESIREFRKAVVRRSPFILLAVLAAIACYPLALIRLHFALAAIGSSCGVSMMLAALVLSRAAGVLSMIPMGLGVRDLSLAGLLVLGGVPVEASLSAAAFDRLLMTLPYLTGGVLSIPLLIKWERAGSSGALDHKDPSMEAECPEAAEKSIQQSGECDERPEEKS
jgi:uncharacterized membrane protein YbhN (UPF0104 family)